MNRSELKRLKRLEIQIRQKKEQAERLRQSAMLMGSLSLNTDKVQTSKSGSQMEDAIVELVDLERSIKKLIVKWEKARNKIISQIQKLTDERYIEVLHLRYVDCKRIKEIADQMGYSQDHTRHLIGKAVKAFEKLK